ncbi:MIP/aquaporin family protein [Spiroplasma endosymbiont of Othius punctulatus]|uniref:MIP/aquaporin family protein n=1 Tax=Spiroplasma endosymbiont of Othius punctulatus TaxID=3066289 RepID=UPI0030CAFADF
MTLTTLILTELFGTALLVLLGNAIVANVVFKKTNGENAGWTAISIGYGFAVAVAAFIALLSGGAAHLNPAVSLAVLIGSNFDPFGNGLAWWIALAILAQLVGAALGQILCNLVFFNFIKEAMKSGDEFQVANVRGMHVTGINETNNKTFAFIAEFLGTAVLVAIVCGFSGFAGTPNAIGAAAGIGSFGPLLVGLAIMVVGFGLGGTTGFALNPARDLMPRVVYQLMPGEKASAQWSYSWVPVVAPLAAGAVVGALFLI